MNVYEFEIQHLGHILDGEPFEIVAETIEEARAKAEDYAERRHRTRNIRFVSEKAFDRTARAKAEREWLLASEGISTRRVRR